jgi:hypothetical protein
LNEVEFERRKIIDYNMYSLGTGVLKNIAGVLFCTNANHGVHSLDQGDYMQPKRQFSRSSGDHNKIKKKKREGKKREKEGERKGKKRKGKRRNRK